VAGDSDSRPLWLVLSAAGEHRDLTVGARQQAWWDEHAAFINALVDEGDVLLGGPLEDEGGAVLVIRADNARLIRDRLAADPWYVNGILRLVDVKRWEVFIDLWRPAD
jgi:uncharacterized protein YciI